MITNLPVRSLYGRTIVRPYFMPCVFLHEYNVIIYLMDKIKNNAFIKKHAKFIKFVMTGGFNTVLDISIYSLLANVAHLSQVPSNIISTSICTVISFFLNEKFVWRSAKKRRETAPKFLIVTLFSAYVVQTIVIKICLGVLGEGDWQNIFAKLAACGCGMITNFFGYKVVFTSRQSQEEHK